ncbi:major facilitator superfamily domain-containing protein 1-like isoform X2 [Halichondria panicea]|uniref:major facilitator superfamily domain-containing protein 1-like isoform X2 n=1 Tax=Halichondria panicea TaxID=6063 RepID=UPI00312BB858
MEDQNEKQSLLQKDTSSIGSNITEVLKINPPSVALPEDVEMAAGFNCETFLPCDPRRWLHRFLMIFLMCMLSFGSYYVYDNPAALQRTFINVMGIDTAQYSLLYSLYSWPNVILSIFGGFLLDRVFGIRIGTVVFSALIVVGQIVFALGGFVNSFAVMLVGRFIFGLGGENLAVAQNTYAVAWFKGRELNMVFGLLLSVSRLGSTVNMNTNNIIYSGLSGISPNYVRLGIVLMFGAGYCLLSLLAAVVLGLFDKRAERITKRKEATTGEKISLKDIKSFPLILWLVFIVCVTYYVTVFPFIGLANVFLIDKYGVTTQTANVLNSLVYIMSAAISPFLGVIVDKTGFNLFWMNLGVVLTLGAHAMFAFLPATPIFPYIIMIIMGLAYSLLACALWPLVSFIVPEYQLGTAYGIMQAVQNLGLAVVTYVAGAIVDSKGYLILEVFFMACLCICVIAGILIYILDSGAGGKLNMSAWHRRKVLAEEEALEQKEKEAAGNVSTSSGGKDIFESGGSYNYTSPFKPNSAFHIRNRLLSKMGAPMPEHVAEVTPFLKSYAHVGFFK